MQMQEMKELDYKEIGRRIRMRRELLEISREKLAERVDLSTQFISDIEYGHKRMSLKSLYKVCQALDMSADYVLAGKPAQPDEDGSSVVREEINSLLLQCNKAQLDGISKIMQIYENGTRMR